MSQVYIALGTNIEPRKQYLEDALKLLSEHKDITILKVSSIYETDPVGYMNQADFLNMVIEVKTELLAEDFLDYCQAIEKRLGRKRGIRYGPRTIDLDLLVYKHKKIETDRLTIPHPRMHERAFVLVPLQEIAPDLSIVGVDKSLNELIKNIDPATIKGVRKL